MDISCKNCRKHTECAHPKKTSINIKQKSNSKIKMS